MESLFLNLKCSSCGKIHSSGEPQNVCECGFPLLAQYDLAKLASFKRTIWKDREPSLWRYKELLPVKDETNIVSLGEVTTPILFLTGLSSEWESRVFMKDEGILPTGTFKARGAAIGVSMAKELGISSLSMPTNGNAGAAWAAYCARAGIKGTYYVPEDAPPIHRQEIQEYGGELRLVKGTIADAGKISKEFCRNYGIFNASTLFEPYRIEGKKTLGFELVEQFSWEVPDVIVYPTGGGVGLIGIHKAIKELQGAGWLSGKMPRFVAVQSSGCAPVVKAWEEKASFSTAWENAYTSTYGLNVPKPLGDFLILDILKETGGCAIQVEDADIMEAWKNTAKKEGLLISREGAATICASQKLRERGYISATDKVLLINTGSGLKALNA